MMVIIAKVRLEHKFSEGSLIVETGGYFVLHEFTLLLTIACLLFGIDYKSRCEKGVGVANLWAYSLCFFFRCQPNQETCACSRCGRVHHLWGKPVQREDCEYELCGQHSDGHMVYAETQRLVCTCLRCGESYIKTIRKHVHH
jgi:hypothetical protein